MEWFARTARKSLLSKCPSVMHQRVTGDKTRCPPRAPPSTPSSQPRRAADVLCRARQSGTPSKLSGGAKLEQTSQRIQSLPLCPPKFLGWASTNCGPGTLRLEPHFIPPPPPPLHSTSLSLLPPFVLAAVASWLPSTKNLGNAGLQCSDKVCFVPPSDLSEKEGEQQKQ